MGVSTVLPLKLAMVSADTVLANSMVNSLSYLCPHISDNMYCFSQIKLYYRHRICCASAGLVLIVRLCVDAYD